jgi:signal transduction histidine kinase
MLNTSQQATDALEAIAEAFNSLPPGVAGVPDSLERARAWSGALATGGHQLPDALSAAAFAVELLLLLPESAVEHPDSLRDLIEQIESAAGVPRAVLAWMVYPGDGAPEPAGGLLATLVAALRPGERPPEAVAERQLAQLRFDLHDGPLQDVLLLAEDLRMFQSQVESALADHPLRPRLVGSLDDLKAMLVALDGDLRRISALLESPFLRGEPFPEALAQLTKAFAARAAVTPDLLLEGDFSALSDAHQITLLGLVREALSNIREHSAADRVSITIRSDEHGVVATVVDDGRGFDPETALIKAAREGHLGLVGMHERVRMLGGSTQIDSHPGGPTTISASLPAVADSSERTFTFGSPSAD